MKENSTTRKKMNLGSNTLSREERWQPHNGSYYIYQQFQHMVEAKGHFVLYWPLDSSACRWSSDSRLNYSNSFNFLEDSIYPPLPHLFLILRSQNLFRPLLFRKKKGSAIACNEVHLYLFLDSHSDFRTQQLLDFGWFYGGWCWPGRRF